MRNKCRIMRLWYVLTAVQITLLVTALVLDSRPLLIASLCVSTIGIALGVPIVGEHYKKRRETK